MPTISAIPPATQVPRDTYVWTTSGVLVQPIDMHNNIVNQINEYDYAIADLFANQNGVIGNNALQVSANASGPAPMQFAVSTGRARVLNALKITQLVTPGILGQPSSFNFSIPNGSTIPGGQSRIDVVYLQINYTTYTDSNNEPHQVDTTVIGTVQGTPASNPSAPSLPGIDCVSLAYITVPTGATSSTQCTIDNTQRNTYQDIGTIQSLWQPGDIKETANTNLESGWLWCDGSSYLRTAYPKLFAAISTNYGSVDGSHFNVPDLRGRESICPDGMGTQGNAGRITGPSNTLGSSGGQETVTQTLNTLVAHTHTDSGHSHGVTDGGHNHTQNAHNHSITDSGHSHGVTDGGHNHTQNAHNHTDSGHNHSQNVHAHTDTGHTHSNSLNDSGHYHIQQAQLGGGSGSVSLANNVGSTAASPTLTSTTNSSTGITISNANSNANIAGGTATNNSSNANISSIAPTNNSNVTSISINSGSTGINSSNNTIPTNNSATTGLTVNNSAANNSNTGSGNPINTMDPWQMTNKIIKY